MGFSGASVDSVAIVSDSVDDAVSSVVGSVDEPNMVVKSVEKNPGVSVMVSSVVVDISGP